MEAANIGFFKRSEKYTEEIFHCFSPGCKQMSKEPFKSDSLRTRAIHVIIGNTVTSLCYAIKDVICLVIYLVAALVLLIAAVFNEHKERAKRSLACLELVGEASCLFVRDVLRAIPLLGHVIAKVLDLLADKVVKIDCVGKIRDFRNNNDILPTLMLGGHAYQFLAK